MSINFSNKRPIVFVANSSWYLMHYRNGLIKECSKRNKVITISPIDQSTEYLSSISLHLSWRMQRKKDQDIFELFFSTLRMFFLLKAIKPTIKKISKKVQKTAKPIVKKVMKMGGGAVQGVMDIGMPMPDVVKDFGTTKDFSFIAT